MKQFLIERSIPGAGKMTEEELQDLSRTSVAVISILGKPYHWIQSFVTENKLYCIHEAENEDDIRRHANCGDFPVTSIEEIKAVIDATTGTKGN
jgi:hypothetical protein